MSTDKDRELEGIETLKRDDILPAKRNLTVIWEDEKQEFLRRIESLEVKVWDLERGELEKKAAEAFKQAAGMMGELKQRVETLEATARHSHPGVTGMGVGIAGSIPIIKGK